MPKFPARPSTDSMFRRCLAPHLLAGLSIVAAGMAAQAQPAEGADAAEQTVEDAAGPAADAAAAAGDAPYASSPADGLQDAVGVPNGDGTYSTYADAFCAGYATAFRKHGGDKAMEPACPEEPIEPLERSASEKGERAGKASAQAYVQFQKQQQANKDRAAGKPFLSGFYDKSQDGWISNEPGYYRYTSFDGAPYASISKEDGGGMGVIDRSGRILVPLQYGGVGFERSRSVILVHSASGNKTGLYDLQGNLLLEPEYDAIDVIDAKRLLTRQGERYDVRDRQGRLIFSSDKPIIPAGEDRYWYMDQPQRWGILDEHGKPLVKPEFTYTSSFKNGKLTSQKDGGENYVVHRDGRVVKLP
ncbi:WG repeat-containing protein [Bordetella genomosp. 13]|uniref:WG repeat-containing protein n=1 Tax=Bordetella genomosp. 13 TaxID=463040 RepID=UPI001642D1D9|nr:WG repeat-containing protein [Bordetella genomosp. 13]